MYGALALVGSEVAGDRLYMPLVNGGSAGFLDGLWEAVCLLGCRGEVYAVTKDEGKGFDHSAVWVGALGWCCVGLGHVFRTKQGRRWRKARARVCDGVIRLLSILFDFAPFNQWLTGEIEGMVRFFITFFR